VRSAALFARPSSGSWRRNHAIEERPYDPLLLGIEIRHRFELQAQLVVEGGLRGARLAAPQLHHVNADAFGRRLLGEAALFAPRR
jgi:hypothetical protein